MSFIKPTVGRVVWYIPKNVDNLEQHNNDPLKADIIAVHSPEEVSLFVISASGQTRYISKAPLWQLESGKPKPEKGGYAMWMPYQLGQAAKTEEVLGRVRSSIGPEELIKGHAPKEAVTDPPLAGQDTQPPPALRG
jgi:hypothetical protein